MDPYDIDALYDRMEERRQAGGDLDVFDVEFGALTPDELSEWHSLLDQHLAHGDEQLEAVRDRVRARYEVQGVLAVHGCRTLKEAIEAGAISEADADELRARAGVSAHPNRP